MQSYGNINMQVWVKKGQIRNTSALLLWLSNLCHPVPRQKLSLKKESLLDLDDLKALSLIKSFYKFSAKNFVYCFAQPPL